MKTKKSLAFPANGDLGALRNRVTRRREYLDLLETELSNTQAIIREFASLYEKRIRPLENEQKRLHSMLEELTADLKPPVSDWRGRGRRGHPETAAEGPDTPRQKKKTAAKDAQYERKVRELFRRLAKQYHPDLAQDAKAKEECEELMAEINRAYQAKDLEALEALANSRAAGNRSSNAPEAELARLKLELRQLDAMIFEVEQTIRELDLSPAMQLQSESRGDRPGRRDVLADMEADYRARIGDLREQLIDLGVELEKLDL
ncbi:MAG: hypothetical protein WD751_09745 [Anaerolineales bacterium]